MPGSLYPMEIPRARCLGPEPVLGERFSLSGFCLRPAAFAEPLPVELARPYLLCCSAWFNLLNLSLALCLVEAGGNVASSGRAGCHSAFCFYFQQSHIQSIQSLTARLSVTLEHAHTSCLGRGCGQPAQSLVRVYVLVLTSDLTVQFY